MFIELDLPETGSHGEFYISSIDEIQDGFMFLRNDGKGLDDGEDDMEKYLFETLVDAHVAMIDYYNANIMLYPYNDEYMDCMGNDLTLTPEQRAMEFV